MSAIFELSFLILSGGRQKAGVLADKIGCKYEAPQTLSTGTQDWVTET